MENGRGGFFDLMQKFHRCEKSPLLRSACIRSSLQSGTAMDFPHRWNVIVDGKLEQWIFLIQCRNSIAVENHDARFPLHVYLVYRA
jgi:hypothetical protein